MGDHGQQAGLDPRSVPVALDVARRGRTLAGSREAAADALGIGVACLHVGAELRPTDADAIRMAFGLERTGAALIRPDGFIAARSADLAAYPAVVLAQALGSVSSATRGPSHQRTRRDRPPRSSQAAIVVACPSRSPMPERGYGVVVIEFSCVRQAPSSGRPWSTASARNNMTSRRTRGSGLQWPGGRARYIA